MKIAGLHIKVDRTAYPAYGIVALIPTVIMGAYAAITRPPRLAVPTVAAVPLVGACLAVYHAVGQFVHQLGHALAARATGYPMTGVRYEYAFTYSEYPPDEPLLQARTHLVRSFGGVAGNALMFVLVLLVWLRGRLSANWFTRWTLHFMLFDAGLLLFASAFLSDGVAFVMEKSWVVPPPEDQAAE